MSWEPWLEAWNFYLPASAVPVGLYFLWTIFGQECVLPLDFGGKFRDRRIVGDGRGWPSIPAAMILGGAVGVFQGRVDEALILALGAQFGCTVNSLLKRAAGVPRGKTVLVADNIDFVVGATLFYAIQFELPWSTVVLGCIVCGLAHFCLGYLIRGALRRFEPVPRVGE